MKRRVCAPERNTLSFVVSLIMDSGVAVAIVFVECEREDMLSINDVGVRIHKLSMLLL